MNSTTIPVTLITGFLGSGKTTLLNRILHAEHGLKIAVLVNDFGAINIDSQLVVGVEEDTISLSNGCICCTIRGDLVKAVLDVLQKSDPPNAIIVEASGVSDPLEVALVLKSVPRIHMDSVLTVIDAEQILDVEEAYKSLVVYQVGMADIVILNKVDLVDAEQLQAVKAYLKRIASRSRILEAVKGDVPLELVLNVGEFDPEKLNSRASQAIHVHDETHDHDHHDHPHTDHSLIFSTWSWQSTQPLSARALQRMVNDLPESIYRAKGIFFLADAPNQKGILQVVGKRASLTLAPSDWSDISTQSRFVAIGRANTLDGEALTAQLEGCLAINAPKSELEYLTKSALAWLRNAFTK